MTEQRQEVPSVEIEGVRRPDLANLPPEVSGYVRWLEERLELLEAELEAKPGAEARGISWFDVYGWIKGEGNVRYKVKGNLTQRSDIDSFHAFRQAFLSLQRLKGEYAMKPFQEDLTYVVPGQNGGQRASGESPEDLEQQTEGQPEGEPRGRRRRESTTQEERQPSEPLGNESWYKVEAITLELTTDKTQKFLKVKCGRWKKHGVAAYLDSSNIPEDVITMIENGDWSVEDAPLTGSELAKDFPEMQYALVAKDDKYLKVVDFANKPS